MSHSQKLLDNNAMEILDNCHLSLRIFSSGLGIVIGKINVFFKIKLHFHTPVEELLIKEYLLK